MSRLIDYTGVKMGRLTGIKYVGDKKWLCVCECGNEKIVSTAHWKRGNQSSCGCLLKETAKETGIKSRTKHGDTRNHYLYNTWRDMRFRCNSPTCVRFHRYGGRGISVSPLFENYIDFKNYILENLGERPDGYSLDRIDNDGNYEPGNLRWATPLQQTLNRACVSNKNVV